VVLALATAVATASVLAIGVTPASAHICPTPDEIPVGALATIDVGVTVENATVPDVEVTIPAGLRLERVDPKADWTFIRTGATVRFRGGPISTFSCSFFSFGVTAPNPGVFGITVVQRDASGAVVSRSAPDPAVAQDRILDQFVYAGVKPPPPPSTSSGPSAVVIAGGVLVGLGVVMAVVMAIRSRRVDDDDVDHEARDDEAPNDDGGSGLDPALQARLDRFKKRKSGDRPPDR
jgi:hypothetical protein